MAERGTQLIETKVETQMPEIDLFAGNTGYAGSAGNGDAE